MKASILNPSLAALAFAATAHAADQTWLNSGPTNNWSTTENNWDAGVPWTQNNNAIFGGTGETVTLTEGISAGGLTFNAGGFTITGNTLTLGGGSVIHTGANNATIYSILAGGPISKTGTGTLTLGGTNSFTGGLNINAGTLQANSYSALSNGAVTLAVTGADNAILYHNSSSGSAATNIVVSGTGSGLAILKWNQDWWGTTGKGYNTYNDWTLTLNRAVNFQSTNSGKQIAAFVTGNGVAAGNVAVKVDGGTQVTWTAAMNAANNAVQVNNFTGNVWITGNTKLQAQNRAYQVNNAAHTNGLIPDAATVIVDAGSTLQIHHGGEVIGFLSGSGTVAIGTGTNNNYLTIAGDSTTPSTSPATLGTAIFSGTFATNQSALTKNGTGTQEFSGTGITFNSGVNLNNGTLKLTKTTAWNSNIAFGASNSPTLQLNSALAADSWTFAKQLTGGSANAKIEKVGDGTVILNPAAGSSYVGSSTGALTVTSGKLYLNGAFTTAPAVSVAAGATFGGTSTAGNVTVAAGGTLEGGMGGTGTLTAADLTLAGTAVLKGGLSAVSGYKALAVNNLTINGGNQSVTLDASGLGLTSGNYYDLLVSANPVTAPNADSVLAAFKSNARAYAPSVSGGNTVQLYYDANASVYWTGANGSAWNTSATNFKLSGSNADTQFMANDVVYFNDGPAGSVVDISDGNVSPVSTTFANTTATAYTLQGANGIASGLITKIGNGTVTITNTNTTNGAVALNSGTVSISQSGGLGTGTVTFDGGTLEYTGGNTTWTRGLAVGAGGGAVEVDAAGTTLRHTGALSGTGTLVKAGGGVLQFGQTSGTIANNLQLDAGRLDLDYGGGNVTYSGNITGSAGILSLTGTGASGSTGLTLAGTNTFSGETHIYGRRIFLNSATGNAIGGDIVIKQSHWPYHGLTIMANEQIADTAVLRFEQTGGAYDFRLNGKTETLAGIASIGGAGQGDPGFPGNWAMIQNAGYDGSNDSNIPAGKLIVAGSGTYAYYGQMRNQNGGSNNGALSFEKAGTGTQTLSGTGITYTGATTVSGGRLVLEDTTAYASASTAVSGGTLELKRTTGTWNIATVMTGTGNIEKSGDGTATLTANSSAFAGDTLVSAGTLLVSGLLGGDVAVAAGASIGGLGTIGGNLTFGAGSKLFITDINNALIVGGTVTFDPGFGLGSLAGWDYTTAADGEYTVLSGAVDTTNLGNLGLANAVTFGDNRKAYFESGSLKVVVIPEPSAVLLLGLGALGLGLRRRR